MRRQIPFLNHTGYSGNNNCWCIAVIIIRLQHQHRAFSVLYRTGIVTKIVVKQITTTYVDIGETASGCNFNCVVKVSDSIILESGQMPFINMIDVNTLKAQVKTLQTTVVSLEERIQALESA